MNIIFENAPPLQRYRTLYGRRQARPLKKEQQLLFDNLLPHYLVYAEDIKNQFNKNKNPVWMEVGFGGGEHLITQAYQNPEVTFIGCEPFINGVGAFLKQLDQRKINNIKVFLNDANLLFEAMPNNFLDKLFLLFPDPWPKKRHLKRRFIQQKIIEKIYHILKPGGEWRIATDHAGYKEWVEEQFNTDASKNYFQRMFSSYDKRPDINDWPQTRYEEKALKANRIPSFFIFRSNKS